MVIVDIIRCGHLGFNGKKAIKENKLSKKFIVMIGDKKTDYLSAKKSKIYFEYRKQNFYKQIKSILEQNAL